MPRVRRTVSNGRNTRPHSRFRGAGRHLSEPTPRSRYMKSRNGLAALVALFLATTGCRIEKWVDAPNAGRLYYTFFTEKKDAERLGACMAQLFTTIVPQAGPFPALQAGQGGIESGAPAKVEGRGSALEAGRQAT